MAGTTAHPLTRTLLTEDFVRPSDGTPRVDRANYVLRGAKLLGLESRNKRRYTRAALQEAYRRRLYENAPVYDGHPKDPYASRDPDDQIGWVQDVRLRPDGLYGDVHLFRAHKKSALLLEAAERNPRVRGLAFSHNADGETRKLPGGWLVVEAIPEVRSVDLVTTGATTRNLFESFTTGKTMKLRALLESLSADRRLTPRVRKGVLTLLEAPEDMDPSADPGLPMDLDVPEPEMDVADPAMPADPMQALSDGFKAAIMGIVDDEAMDAKAKAKAIAKFLKSHEDLLGLDTAAPAEAPVGEGDDYDADGDGAGDGEEEPLKEGCDKPLKESATLKKSTPTAVPLTEAEAQALCRLGGVKPATPLLEALVALPRDKAVALLESQKTAAPPARPRSAAPGQAAVQKPAFPADRKDFAKALLS